MTTPPPTPKAARMKGTNQRTPAFYRWRDFGYRRRRMLPGCRGLIVGCTLWRATGYLIVGIAIATGVGMVSEPREASPELEPDARPSPDRRRRSRKELPHCGCGTRPDVAARIEWKPRAAVSEMPACLVLAK